MPFCALQPVTVVHVSPVPQLNACLEACDEPDTGVTVTDSILGPELDPPEVLLVVVFTVAPITPFIT